MTTHEPIEARYRLRVADYVMLWEAGAFDGLRTELIEGDIVLMSPQYRPHGMVKMELLYRVRDALAAMQSSLYPVAEFSVTLDANSMVDPDIMLTAEPFGDGPVPLASVALAIEVVDSALAKDLKLKARLYATAGVPEYWVADVKARIIHQMWRPDGAAYMERREVHFGARIEAATIAGLAIATDGLR